MKQLIPTDTFSVDYPRGICVEPPIEGQTAYATVLINDMPATVGLGNIGRLAVNMAANRLLSAGASPRYIAATVIVDTDTPMDTVDAVTDAMRDASVEAQMEWVGVACHFTSSGLACGFAISVFGIGQLPPDFSVGRSCVRPGDSIIVTGPVGGLGAAMKAADNNLDLLIDDDGSSLGDAVHSLMRCVADIHYLVCPEKGVTDALKSLQGEVTAEIDRSSVPVSQAVDAVCQMFGLDLLELPTAGVMLVIVDKEDEAAALEALRRSAHASQAAVIGHVVAQG